MRIPTTANTCKTAMLFLAAVLFIQVISIAPLFARDLGEGLVKDQCSTCHKFQGQHESKFNLKAPDLMWGGVKYQRDWLIRWLTGKEPALYPKGYRWDKGRELSG